MVSVPSRGLRSDHASIYDARLYRYPPAISSSSGGSAEHAPSCTFQGPPSASVSMQWRALRSVLGPARELVLSGKLFTPATKCDGADVVDAPEASLSLSRFR